MNTKRNISFENDEDGDTQMADVSQTDVDKVLTEVDKAMKDVPGTNPPYTQDMKDGNDSSASSSSQPSPKPGL